MKTNNQVVAKALREAAALFAQQDANKFRVSAYRNAAKTIEDLPEDVADVAARGPGALDALPHIGKSIARAILQLVTTGRWPQLERMRGELDPEAALAARRGGARRRRGRAAVRHAGGRSTAGKLTLHPGN